MPALRRARNSLVLIKAQEGVQGGTLAGGSPFSFGFVRVRRYAGWFSLACPAIRPHFFGACPKKRCRAAKEKRFEATTSPWWAHPPLPFGRKPQRDKLVRQVGLYMVGRPGAQVSLTQSAVMLGLRVRGRGGRDPTPPVAAPLSAFLWGGTGSRGHNPPPKKTAHTHKPQTPTSPLPKSGEDESRLLRQKRSREWWSHQGKKALFFGGSTPFLWASTKEMGSNGRTGQRPPPNVSAHTYKRKEKGPRLS